MSELLKELEDELKQERLFKFLKKYANFLIGIVVLVIVVTITVSWRDSVKTAKALEASEEYRKVAFVSVGESVEDDIALTALNKLIEKSPPSFQMLSLMKKATILQEQDKSEEAIVIYNEIANNSSFDLAFRELARLFIAHRMIEDNSEDSAKIEQILMELSSERHPWRFSAMELHGLYLLEKNKKKEASEIFKMLKADKITPSSTKKRIEKIEKIVRGF